MKNEQKNTHTHTPIIIEQAHSMWKKKARVVAHCGCAFGSGNFELSNKMIKIMCFDVRMCVFSDIHMYIQLKILINFDFTRIRRKKNCTRLNSEDSTTTNSDTT